MLFILYLFLGFLLGSVIAWLISANRTRSKFENVLKDSRQCASMAEGKISAMEGTINEIRNQAEQVRQKAAEDFEKLRADLAREREAKVRAETQANEIQQRIEEEKKLIIELKGKLTDAFKALASDTLSTSNESFLKLARETFDKILTAAKGDLGRKQEAISGLIRPMSESLKQFEEHVRQLEKSRESAYVGIEEHLKILASSQQQLTKETGSLVTALRTPHIRGQWGQMTLRKAVELAGMSEHCDFTEQVVVQTDDGIIKPDLVVHLPADREIVVDAKVALDAYLNAQTSNSEDEQKDYLINHARQVRAHMNKLGEKAYSQQFDRAPDFVVMFIPGESFFAAAAHNDLDLIEDAMLKGVVIATPSTLMALLRTIAYGWRQERIAENAQIIRDLGVQLHDRMRVLVEHISGIGKGLERATTAYNSAVGSFENRVMPAARRFKELGVTSGENISLLEPIDTNPRRLIEPESGPPTE